MAARTGVERPAAQVNPDLVRRKHQVRGEITVPPKSGPDCHYCLRTAFIPAGDLQIYRADFKEGRVPVRLLIETARKGIEPIAYSAICQAIAGRLGIPVGEPGILELYGHLYPEIAEDVDAMVRFEGDSALRALVLEERAVMHALPVTHSWDQLPQFNRQPDEEHNGQPSRTISGDIVYGLLYHGFNVWLIGGAKGYLLGMTHYAGPSHTSDMYDARTHEQAQVFPAGGDLDLKVTRPSFQRGQSFPPHWTRTRKGGKVRPGGIVRSIVDRTSAASLTMKLSDARPSASYLAVAKNPSGTRAVDVRDITHGPFKLIDLFQGQRGGNQYGYRFPIAPFLIRQHSVGATVIALTSNPGRQIEGRTLDLAGGLCAWHQGIVINGERHPIITYPLPEAAFAPDPDGLMSITFMLYDLARWKAVLLNYNDQKPQGELDQLRAMARSYQGMADIVHNLGNCAPEIVATLPPDKQSSFCVEFVDRVTTAFSRNPFPTHILCCHSRNRVYQEGVRGIGIYATFFPWLGLLERQFPIRWEMLQTRLWEATRDSHQGLYTFLTVLYEIFPEIPHNPSSSFTPGFAPEGEVGENIRRQIDRVIDNKL